jgi:hypothetical protein
MCMFKLKVKWHLREMHVLRHTTKIEAFQICVV